MAKYQLKDLTLDEVSFVDSPANKLAKVVLFKRALPKDHVEKAPAGIQFNVGFKPEGGSEVQSVVFDAEKWSKKDAVTWLEDHNMKHDKVDETENTLRFRQKDPGDFKRFRMITPGTQIAKALYSTQDSYQKIMQLVDSAVRMKFQPTTYSSGGAICEYIYVRDLIDDSAFFEQNGKCFRVEYSIDSNEAGDMVVTLGDRIPVEFVYQDITPGSGTPAEDAADVAKNKPISAELAFKLGQLQAKASYLDRRLSKLSERAGLHRVK